jgi:hypothetical protein
VLDRVAELDAPGGGLPHPAADAYRVVVPGGLAVTDRGLADHQPEARGLELPIAHAVQAQVFRSRDVQPDQVAGMVHDAHLVGLGVIDADQGFRHQRDRRHATSWVW